MGNAQSYTRYSRPRTLSLVIPAYNEEESLPELRAALDVWIPAQSWKTNVLLVNDGSQDRTGRFLEEWAGSTSWLAVIHLSRNFGHQAALTAGLDNADGDVVVVIDADLQDPLEVIPTMVEKYCEGFDVVYGRRADRQGESASKRITAWLFYRAMQKLIYKHLPPDAGDFRLVSKRCLKAVLEMREKHRFLRGMFSWAGFAQTSVSYSRQPRKSGTTKYTYRKMMLFAWSAVLSFSPLPLRIILVQGVLVAAFGIGYTIYSVLRWAVVGDTVAGWPTLVSLLGLIGGAILIALGLIGEYISRIYEELKDRPLYIISHTNNLHE
jgi:dolichol-phosphate mannosyltransferase